MRKTGEIILTIGLIICMTFLIINITIKDVVGSIFQESWKTITSKIPFKEGNNEYVEKAKDFIGNLFHDEEVEIEEEDELDSEDDTSTSQKIFNFISNNKEKISEITGIEVPDDVMEEVSDMIEKKDFSSVIEKIEKYQEDKMTPEQKRALKIIRFFSNDFLKKILIILIILHLIGIALLQFSLYKWIRNLSLAMMISGGLVALIAYSLKLFVLSVFSGISMNINPMLKPSIICIVASIVLLIIYIILRIILKPKKKERKDEKVYDENGEEIIQIEKVEKK
ncbi:MAG: hypothetical protein IJG68_06085 [Bacilli bacterium]|nr:hypothetical protein [Bacilli bacterium]